MSDLKVRKNKLFYSQFKAFIFLGICLFLSNSIQAQDVFVYSIYKKHAGVGTMEDLPAERGHWKVVKVGNGTYVQFQNRFDPKKYLHIQHGKLEASEIGAMTWGSSHWKQIKVGNTKFVQLQNKWKKDQYLHTETGAVSAGKLGAPGWRSAHWELVDVPGGYVKIKCRISRLVVEKDDFHMIFAADPQYPWVEKNNTEVDSDDEDEVKKYSIIQNKNYVSSINAHVQNVGKNKVKGLVINGDLTAFGHGWQLDKFKEIYSKVSIPMYLGLGNHDYTNNVDDCYENSCANRMVEYMIEHIQERKYKSYDIKQSNYYKFPEYVKEKTGSLAYSWDVGNVHFVQLHNYPTYMRTWSNYVSNGDAARKIVNITTSLEWLETDLTKARNAGKAIILNFHDANDGSSKHWQDEVKLVALVGSSNLKKQAEQNIKDFKNMLKTFKVSAIFVGHLHNKIGKFDKMEEVPVIYSGSPTHERYLSVRFRKDKMQVLKINSADGNAQTTGRVSSYDLIMEKPATPMPMPSTSGVVTFFNESGYVARYLLSYIRNGKWVNIETGNIALGNKKSYTIPKDAKEIWVKGEGKTGLIWEPWRQTFRELVAKKPTGVDKCYKSYGTTLNQKWNNNCN